MLTYFISRCGDIGKPRSRIDSASKVDGSAEFGIDVKLPGLLYAALAQSPVLGGKVIALDAAAAEAAPGVRKVIAVDGGVVIVAEHFCQALSARNALKITWDPGSNAHLDNAAIRAMLEEAANSGQGLSARADGDAVHGPDADFRRPHSPRRRGSHGLADGRLGHGRAGRRLAVGQPAEP